MGVPMKPGTIFGIMVSNIRFPTGNVRVIRHVVCFVRLMKMHQKTTLEKK